MSIPPNSLFGTLTTAFKNRLAKRAFDAERGNLFFDSGQGDELSSAISGNLRLGGFCTFLVPSSQVWNPLSYYYESVRTAAVAGKAIHRAFLLPMKSAKHSVSLREHVRLDQEAGIDVSVLFVGNLISKAVLPLRGSLEFGIWDEEIVCVAQSHNPTARSGGGGWLLSDQSEQLEATCRLKDLLLAQAEPMSLGDSDEHGVELEEPMLTTAPIAAELAPILCKGNYVSQEDCSWYHSVWQYLRIFDMVSTPTWHANFYLENIGKLASKGDRRVFVSGTADYSMLAHVLKAFEIAGLTSETTVADLCETPLLLCRWYARYVATKIEAHCGDIFSYQPASPFDLVVTDAFLTRFAPEDRARLLQKWCSLLRPGGTVLTTVRIEPGMTGEIVESTKDQAVSFGARALREASKWGGFIDRSPEEIAGMAEIYAERMVSHSVKSREELEALFEQGGFDIQVELATVPGEMQSTTYARVLGTKRETLESS